MNSLALVAQALSAMKRWMKIKSQLNPVKKDIAHDPYNAADKLLGDGRMLNPDGGDLRTPKPPNS